MIALVGALRAHSPAFAMQALKNVCIHGLPGVLPLACIGFLHLAKVFIAQSDEERHSSGLRLGAAHPF